MCIVYCVLCVLCVLCIVMRVLCIVRLLCIVLCVLCIVLCVLCIVCCVLLCIVLCIVCCGYCVYVACCVLCFLCCVLWLVDETGPLGMYVCCVLYVVCLLCVYVVCCVVLCFLCVGVLCYVCCVLCVFYVVVGFHYSLLHLCADCRSFSLFCRSQQTHKFIILFISPLPTLTSSGVVVLGNSLFIATFSKLTTVDISENCINPFTTTTTTNDDDDDDTTDNHNISVHLVGDSACSLNIIDSHTLHTRNPTQHNTT